jgi:small-conductance mechanosensitive channel
MEEGIVMKLFLTSGVPAIAVIILGLVVERVLSVVISRTGRKRQLPHGHVQLTKNITRWIIVMVVAVVIAAIFGVTVTNLWTAISAFVIMMAVGFFAAWSFLSNILATLVILVLRPFSMGDRITILPEDLTGEIVNIGIIFSRLQVDDGDVINMPNNTFMTRFLKLSATSQPDEVKAKIPPSVG